MIIFGEVYKSVLAKKDEIGYVKTEGVHLYINVDNLNSLVNKEEDGDEEIKRTIHMLNTFFDGVTYIVKYYGGELEKLTRGRAHFYFEFKQNEEGLYGNENKEEIVKQVISSCIAIFNYNYNIFNKIGKYSGYDNFKISAGIDTGKFYKYTIEINDEDSEFTTIGSVANIAAKLQSVAYGKQIIFTESLYELTGEELINDITPEEVSGDQLSTIKEKTDLDEDFYYINYSNSLNDVISGMDSLMEKVKERSNKKANEVKLSEMSYSKLYSKLKFTDLSIKNNKKVEGVILYSDIRGFTKLFMNDDSNLDELFIVMQSIYEIFQGVVNEFNGTRVQFQGDRLVAVFNDYDNENEKSYIRSIKAAAEINTKIKELNQLNIIEEDISVGTGISFGNMVATKTGMKRNMDNLVMSKVTSQGNKAEDKYAADDFDVVVYKSLKEKWDEDESAWCTVFIDLFKSINHLGYYKAEGLDIETLQDKYKQKIKKAEKALKDFAFSSRGARNRRGVRPWGE